MTSTTDTIIEMLIEHSCMDDNKVRDPQSHLVGDLWFDHLDFSEFAGRCRRRFGILMSDSELASCATIADVARLIDTKLGGIRED